MQAVIAGFGFLGARIAADLAAAGYSVTAVRRSAATQGMNGIQFVAADLVRDIPRLQDKNFDMAVFCLAPDSRSDDLYQGVYVTAQENFLRGVKAAQYVFVSSTAVYPDIPGTYTEEAGSAHSNRARILLEAETLALSAGAAVLRLAGLYSKERPIYHIGSQGYTEDKLIHFIHRDDAARAVVHALMSQLKGVYNVHDGQPQRRSTILGRLGLPSPAPGIGQDRLISGKKFFQSGFNPLYPDYFAGVKGSSISG